MTNYTFAGLSEWARATEDRMLAVVQTSLERTLEYAQLPKAQGGNMPVKEGTLRNSLMSSLNGGTSLVGPASYTIVLNDLVIGNTAEFGWGGLASAYARRQNYGFFGADSLGRVYDQAGNHWIEKALAKFPGIVAEECAKAQSVVEA